MGHRVITFDDLLQGKAGPELQSSAAGWEVATEPVPELGDDEDEEEVFTRFELFDVRGRYRGPARERRQDHRRGPAATAGTDSSSEDEVADIKPAPPRKRKLPNPHHAADPPLKLRKLVPVDPLLLRRARHVGLDRLGDAWVPCQSAAAAGEARDRTPAGWVVDPEVHDGRVVKVYRWPVSIFTSDAESRAYKGVWSASDPWQEGFVVVKATLADAFEAWSRDLGVHLAEGLLDARPSAEEVIQQLGVVKSLARRPWRVVDELQAMESQDLTPLLSFNQFLRDRAVGVPVPPHSLYHEQALALSAADRNWPVREQLPPWRPGMPRVSPAWGGAALRPLHAVALAQESSDVVSVCLVVKMPGFSTAKSGECVVSEEVILAGGQSASVGADSRQEVTQLVAGVQLVLRHSELHDEDVCSAAVQMRANAHQHLEVRSLRMGAVKSELARARSELFDAASDLPKCERLANKSASALVDVSLSPDLRLPLWQTIMDRASAERDFLLPDGTIVYYALIAFCPAPAF